MTEHGGLTPAPLYLRLAATGLTVARSLPRIAVVLVVASRWFAYRERNLSPAEALEARERLLKKFHPYLRVWGGAATLDRLRQRGRARPAFARLGLVQVDVRTGGAPTLAGAVRVELYATVTPWLLGRLVTPRVEAVQAAVKRARAEAETAAEIAGTEPDEAELNRAIGQRMQGQPGCGLPLAILVAPTFLDFLAIPVTPRRQRIRQMIAGTMTVKVDSTRAEDVRG